MNIPLGRIETSQTYLDFAFSQSKKKASETRSGAKGKRINKSREIELKRIDFASEKLTGALNAISEAFPSFDSLHIFYKELIKLYFDVEQMKKSLASVKWAVTKVNELHRLYAREISKIALFREVNTKRNEFFGRVSSILKRINKHLVYLEECRKIMKQFPKIKTNLITGSIIGFPNVGKSTLLTKITTATPEIASYAFTTRRLNLGYMETDYGKVQLVDTPGTLNRFNKMNDIEKLAYMSMKYVSHFFVFIFDLTGTETVENQLKLLENVTDEFEREIVVYFSKKDLLDLIKKNMIEDYMKNFKSDNKAVTLAIKKGIYEEKKLLEEITRLSKML